MTCKTCKWWNRKDDRGGTCTNFVIVLMNRNSYPPRDGIGINPAAWKFTDGEKLWDMEILTGPDFGCPHHEPAVGYSGTDEHAL